MDFESSMKISASGMTAHRAWMNVLSSNLANVNTTRAAGGKPYERRTIVYESVPVAGQFDDVLQDTMDEDVQQVKIVEVVPDGREFKKVYEPGHPDAGKDGILEMPNINPVEEMANMLTATRSYEANLAALNMSKQMAMKAIEIGK